MSQAKLRPVVLLILDGWGIAPDSAGNAITQAAPKNFEALKAKYPNGILQAAGEAVGLPVGEDGNSEVGHLNIGTGRIVLQSLPRINMSIVDGSFFENPAFLKAVDHVKKNNSDLHLLGLIGSGGVHAYNDHLYALIQLAKKNGIERLWLHLMTDGRDSQPTAAKVEVARLQQELKTIGLGEIATIMGRYYGMDRDLRWERTQAAYDALTDAPEKAQVDPITVLEESYQNHWTDEFVKPVPIGTDIAKSRIKDNDAVIFYNFRLDRPRQLTKALVMPDFDEKRFSIKGFDPYAAHYQTSHFREEQGEVTFKRKVVVKNLVMVTMTEYEPGLPVEVAFAPEVFEMSLGEVVAKADKKQLRLAETEKERFVTFYFNGRKEAEFEGEDRLMLESPKVATYDLKPEMASEEVTQAAVKYILEGGYDLYVINIACPDMVAHTGLLEPTKKAILAADRGIGEIAEAVLGQQGILLITADHGNAEELYRDGTTDVDTEHSTNPVPLIIVGDDLAEVPKTLPQGVLADVAPTILKLMKLDIPKEMTGRALF